MGKQMSVCPSPTCGAEKPHHEVIGPTKAAQAGQPNLSTSARCTICGCVWRLDEDGNKVILGNLDDTVAPYEWKPEK